MNSGEDEKVLAFDEGVSNDERISNSDFAGQQRGGAPNVEGSGALSLPAIDESGNPLHAWTTRPLGVEAAPETSPAHESRLEGGGGDHHASAMGTTTRQKPALYHHACEFPWRLYEMLEEAEPQHFSDVVSWMPSEPQSTLLGGTPFRVHQSKRFETEVLPRFFAMSNIRSFRRQLNKWRFERISTWPLVGAYHHSSFVRSEANLIFIMRRSPEKRASRRHGRSSSGGREVTLIHPTVESDTATANTAAIARSVISMPPGESSWYHEHATDLLVHAQGAVDSKTKRASLSASLPHADFLGRSSVTFKTVPEETESEAIQSSTRTALHVNAVAQPPFWYHLHEIDLLSHAQNYVDSTRLRARSSWTMTTRDVESEIIATFAGEI